MKVLSRRSVLAIAAVVDVALHARTAPVAAKALAASQIALPSPGDIAPGPGSRQDPQRRARAARRLWLARDGRRITVGEIARVAMALSTAHPDYLGASSVLLERVIEPAIRGASESFLADLDSITVEQMCQTAERLHVLEDEKVGGEFPN